MGLSNKVSNTAGSSDCRSEYTEDTGSGGPAGGALLSAASVAILRLNDI
ncbi:MAG: hypothetical protein ACYCSW_11440 [bacterium]